MTVERRKITAGEDKNVDSISQNYHEMNETGKAKLMQVSEQLLKVWVTVNSEPEKAQKMPGIKKSGNL